MKLTGGSGGLAPTEASAAAHSGRPDAAVPAVFVGRERELGALHAGFTDAARGRGHLFLITGEAGVGKTRLADEIAASARASGAQVLWGRCWEGEGAPEYWPWLQILRVCVADVKPHVVAERLGANTAYLAQILPELGEAIPGLSVPPTLEPEHARFHLFDAAATLLKSAATERPIVLVLDDAHAADVPSLLLLQFAARELRHTRMLVIVTYRDAEARRAPLTAELLGEVTREGKALPLVGLPRAEVEELVKAYGVSPSGDVLSALYDATAGNPFFVDQTVRLLAAEGRLERDASVVRLGIPDGIPRRAVFLDLGMDGANLRRRRGARDQSDLRCEYGTDSLASS